MDNRGSHGVLVLFLSLVLGVRCERLRASRGFRFSCGDTDSDTERGERGQVDVSGLEHLVGCCLPAAMDENI